MLVVAAREETNMKVSFPIPKDSLLCSELTFHLLYWCVLCVVMEYTFIIYWTSVSIEGNVS